MEETVRPNRLRTIRSTDTQELFTCTPLTTLDANLKARFPKRPHPADVVDFGTGSADSDMIRPAKSADITTDPPTLRPATPFC